MVIKEKNICSGHGNNITHRSLSMVSLKLFFIPIFFFLFVTAVHASSTQQYNKIFLTPFYRLSMSNNGNYSYLVNVSPPDNIASVISAIVSFDIYISPSVNFTLNVNGTPCNTPFYYISTTYSGAGQSRIAFDCSNIIKKKGVYNVTLGIKLANTGSSTGWLDLTYMNNPKPDLNLFGTEYQIGDSARVWLQLLDNDKQPVNNAICLMNMYHPDTSVWLLNAPMSFLNNSEGIYYYDLIAPDYAGVYMTSVRCNYIIEEAKNYAWDFTLNLGTLVVGSYTDTYTYNSVYHSIKETTSGIMDFDYVFHTSEIPNNYTGMVIRWKGKFNDPADPVKLYLYDWCNARWSQPLPNTITKYIIELSNYLPKDQWNVSCYIRTMFGSNDLLIKFNSSSFGTGRYQIDNDFLEVGLLYTAFGETNEIKGSGELHVSEYPSSVFISTTEYSVGETGSFIQQFFISEAGRLNPINNGNCYGSIYFPNGSMFVNNTEFYYKNGTNGLYSFNIVIPNAIGVYSIDGHCLRKGIKTYSSGTFHVSSWAEGIMNMTINGTLINEYYLMFAGGTEYVGGEESTLSVQFMRTVAGNPSPINDADFCNGTIFYPNITQWKNVTFSYIPNTNGLYYNRTILPSVLGVYTIDAVCKKGGITTYSSHTFHVTSWANQIFNLTNITETGFNQTKYLIISHNSTVYIFLQNMNTTMTNYYLSLNQTAYDIKTTLDELYYWFASKIAVIS